MRFLTRIFLNKQILIVTSSLKQRIFSSSSLRSADEMVLRYLYTECCNADDFYPSSKTIISYKTLQCHLSLNYCKMASQKRNITDALTELNINIL